MVLEGLNIPSELDLVKNIGKKINSEALLITLLNGLIPYNKSMELYIYNRETLIMETKNLHTDFCNIIKDERENNPLSYMYKNERGLIEDINFENLVVFADFECDMPICLNYNSINKDLNLSPSVITLDYSNTWISISPTFTLFWEKILPYIGAGSELQLFI